MTGGLRAHDVEVHRPKGNKENKGHLVLLACGVWVSIQVRFSDSIRLQHSLLLRVRGFGVLDLLLLPFLHRRGIPPCNNTWGEQGDFSGLFYKPTVAYHLLHLQHIGAF